MADASKSVKRVGKYEIGKTLGEGTFGKVKYAVNTETGEKVSGRGAAPRRARVVPRRARARPSRPPSRRPRSPARHLLRRWPSKSWTRRRSRSRTWARRSRRRCAARRGAALLAGRASLGGRPNESSPGALPWHSRARPPRARLQISIMKMVKHDHIVKLYEVLASRTKVRARAGRACARRPARPLAELEGARVTRPLP